MKLSNWVATPKIYLFSFVAIFFLPTVMLGKPYNTDSLAIELKTAQTQKDKHQILLQLCRNSRSITIKKYKSYIDAMAKNAATPADKLDVLYYQILHSYVTGDLAQAEDLIKKIPTKLNDKDKFRFQDARTSLLIKTGKNKEAYALALKTLALAEKIKNESYVLDAKITLGFCQMEFGQMGMAKDWFLNILNAPTTEDLEERKIMAITNLAPCYGSLGLIDSAIFYNDLAIEKATFYNDKRTLAKAYLTKGDIKLYLGKKDEVEKYYNLGIAVDKESGDPYFIVSDMVVLSNYYLETGKIKEALAISLQAKQLAFTKNVGAKKVFVLDNLSRVYNRLGNYNLEAETLRELLEYKDSTYAKNSTRDLARMTALYEVEKKEIQIQNQQLEISRKNILLWATLLLLILSGLFVWFFIKNIRIKNAKKILEQLSNERLESAKELLLAQEEQRRQIGASIHDGVGQMISAAKMNLQAIDETPINQPIINKAINILEQCATETRNLAHQLQPASLSANGLFFAIRELIDNLSTKRLDIKLDIVGFHTKPDANIEITIFRSLQEALQNIVKHAHATIVTILLEENEEEITLIIEDNGVGFEKNNIPTKGLGIRNMQNRIALLKGVFDIETAPNSGTRLTLLIPQNAQPANV